MITSRRYVSVFATSNEIKSLLQHIMAPVNFQSPIRRYLSKKRFTQNFSQKNKNYQEILGYYVTPVQLYYDR